MKTVIYLDVLLLVNFVTGYFLLAAAGRITGQRASGPRLPAGAVLSALASCILLLPPLPGPVSAVYQLLSAALIVRVTFGRTGRRAFLRLLTWFFLMNLGLAGLVILAVFRGGFSGMEVNNLSVYVNLSPPVLAGCVLTFYLLIRLLIFCFGQPSREALFPLTLDGPVGSLQLTAFYDTGFFLRDPLTGSQVILVSWPSVHAGLSPPVDDFLRAYFSGAAVLPPPGSHFRLIPCRYAGASASLPGFARCRARLDGPRFSCSAPDVTVAFCPEPLRDGRFGALFGSEFLQCETMQGRNP